MPKLQYNYTTQTRKTMSDGLEYSYNVLARWEFESLNHYVLGLGDISLEGRYRQALVAFFDLEKFTNFCNRPHADVTVPDFLNIYLEWLMTQLREGIKHGENDMTVGIFGALPFYIKFLGDGMLVFWDTEQIQGAGGVMNTIYICAKITRKYKSEFVKFAQGHYGEVPQVLRCGIAKGRVITLGNGNDFVGGCINIAARLQKVDNHTFAVHQSGIDVGKYPKHALAKILVPKKVNLRGIGDNQPVWVLKDELKKPVK